MIKFEHTLFALPFAFLGAIMAANGLPTWRQILWITVAMVGACSAAMTFNRIIDRDIDAENPRTANRELPAGKLVCRFCLGVSLCFDRCVSACVVLAQLADLCPVTCRIDLRLGYSYAKRFTAFAHLLLGFALPSRLQRHGSPSRARSRTRCRSFFRFLS